MAIDSSSADANEGRRPPLAPAAFAERLRAKQFTNNADASAVAELYAKSQATCATEQKLTVAWQNEVQDMGNKARRESKQQLLGALEKRLAGLKKFVRRLKVMRGRLREHARRDRR